MDALEEFDIVQDRQSTAQVKFVEAIEAMAEGFELKRAQIRSRHPHVSDADVEAAFVAWLVSEDDF